MGRKDDAIAKALAFIEGFEGDELQEGIDELIQELRDAQQPDPEPIVRFGSDGQRVEYADADDASEHLLRMAEGLV
jgi:hypothetical protein